MRTISAVWSSWGPSHQLRTFLHTLIRKRKGKGRSTGAYWSQKKKGNGREIKPRNVGAKEIRKRKGRKEAKESIGAKKREDKGIYTLALCIDGSGFTHFCCNSGNLTIYALLSGCRKCRDLRVLRAKKLWILGSEPKKRNFQHCLRLYLRC